MMSKSLLTVLFALVFSATTYAQDKTISGKVTGSDDGLPLPQVSVLLKGTTTGVPTNIDGEYQLNVPAEGGTLIFRYLGYVTQEVEIGNRTVVNVVLAPETTSLGEVVVVAYGTATKESLTGATSVVGAEDLITRNVTSPVAALEGKVTGVQFTSTNGQPGSTPNIVIRGVGTLNGSTNPLFIVDGVQYEGSLNTINQEDIASFTVLKDAASTSLYGSRAANGVVVITTKSGTKGGIKVNASAQHGLVSRAAPLYQEVSPGQYYEAMWEALKNSKAGKGDPKYATSNIYSSLGYNPFNVPNDKIVGLDGKLNPNAKVIYKSLNWYDVLEQAATRQNFNMNVSGGGKNHKLFFSGSYLNEGGYVIRTSFERLTSRLNAEFDAKDWMKIGGSANLTITDARGPSSAGTGSIVNPFGFAKNIGSIYPVYVNDREGKIVRDQFGKPLFDSGEGFPKYDIGSRPVNQGRHALQELTLNNEGDSDNTYGFRFFTDFKILKGLNLRLNYGRDINEGLEKEYENAIIGDAQPTGRFSERRFRRQVENFNQILTYNKTFGDHSINLTAGHESFDRTYSQVRSVKTIQTVAGVREFDNFSNIVSSTGFSSRKAIEGYFSRVNYNYDSKYFVSASYRRDGSSVFQKDYRWGNFYSVGVSWNVHKEVFMQNISFIDRLKLRASYGEVGNDNLLGSNNLTDYFLSQARFNIRSNAGDPGFILNALGNSSLQWETIVNYDFALEFSILDNFLDGSVEYYRRNSGDLLYNLPLAPSVGINIQPNNIGSMYNAGWEVGLTWHLINTQDFKWDVIIQNSTLENKITSLPDPFINGSKRWAVGKSRYDFFLLRTAGVDPATGDQLFYKYKLDENNESVPVLDANGKHETTNNWKDTERAYTGKSSVPDLLGSVSNSLSYSGFSLNFLITYGIGGWVLDNGYADMMHSGSFGSSLHPDILNAWKKPGDKTSVPRMENNNPNLVRTQSERFLTDASFWALRNVSLGYTFNSRFLNKAGLESLRVSLTAENLYIKSKRKGLDPQFNLAGTPEGNNFNPARIFSLGLNLSF